MVGDCCSMCVVCCSLCAVCYFLVGSLLVVRCSFVLWLLGVGWLLVVLRFALFVVCVLICLMSCVTCWVLVGIRCCLFVVGVWLLVVGSSCFICW